jgi:hypothetical protein
MAPEEYKRFLLNAGNYQTDYSVSRPRREQGKKWLLFKIKTTI